MIYQAELNLARSLALQAGQMQMSYYQQEIVTQAKPDGSVVTAIDQNCEKLIRCGIEAKFKNDGILGEEFGSKPTNNGRCWIVDPLDGTLPYLRGIPTFSVLIALRHEAKVVVGVIYLPALSLLFYAAKGMGAYCNDQRIHVSKTTRLQDAVGSSLGIITHADKPEGVQLLQLMRNAYVSYGFMDAYTYCAIARGQIDFSVNLLDMSWDRAPAVCLVEEAGGRFSNLNGESAIDGYGTVLSNGILHDDVLKYFINREIR